MPDATTTPTEPKKKRRKTTPRDPNRAPVKRERSEMYLLVGELESAKKERAALVRRIQAKDGLDAKLLAVDVTIKALGDRMRALMGETTK